MTTSITTKFIALAVALFANSVMLGGVAYLFSAHSVSSVQIQQVALVRAAAVVA